MGLLGTLIFLFLIMHVSQFWVHTRIIKDVPDVNYGSTNIPLENLYGRMIDVFQNPVVVVLYVIGCISLAWHLLHGFQSAFRTVGVHNKKYVAIAKGAGVAFSIIVPFLFAMMPISMYFGWVNMK